jgi:outer membrane protein insertion porin family
MKDKRMNRRNRDNLNWSAVLVFLSTVYCLLSTPIPVLVHASEAEVIKAIEVEGLSRISEEELTGMICFKTGDVIDSENLRTGIRRAYTKGIFYDIQAESVPYDGGIKLRYLIKEIPLIEKIAISGNKNISGNDIKKILLYKEDEDFKDGYIDKARNDLLEFYKRKGFPSASIKITVEKTKETSAVNIYIQVDEGAPLIIDRIDAPDDIKIRLRISEGRIFDSDVVNMELKRLEDYLVKQGYIHPVVGPYEFIDGNLIIPVNKGQKLELYFKGNLSLSTKTLSNEVPFFEEQAVTDESIHEAIDRIGDIYKSGGYYHAQIAAGIESAEDLIKVTFIVFEGKRVLLKKIDLQGISIDPDVIKKILPLEEAKPYNDNLLEAGREAILRFYIALGYLKTDITGIEKIFHNDGSELQLVLNIKEGPQTRIKTIEIEGNKNIDTSEIKNMLQLREEMPYNVIDIGDARYRILSLYSKRGYIDAQVEVESVIDYDKASIIFKIIENKPSVVGKIIYRGNRKTKSKIIKRELTLSEGDDLNFEKLLKTKQRLYKLGIFSEVSIDTMEPVKIGEEKLKRDVLVTLRESNAGSVEISLGYGDYEKLRGAFDINYRNIGGYNREMGFRSEMSSVEQRYVLRFKEPRLFNYPDLPFNALLTKEDTRSVNLETNEVMYKINKTSFLLNIETEYRKKWKTTLGYEYSFVDTKDVQPGVILSKEDTGTVAIGSLSTSLFYDNRDDPFDPASGTLQGFVVKFASKAFLSESEFVKVTAQSSWYFRLAKKVVFAFSLKGGAAYSLDPIKELPLVERFFLGGISTVRGYTNDMLGPKGVDGNPTGGNVYALVNSEFRIALKKGFGVVVFMDAGNVWQLPENINGELKYTSGIGLRYNTPVGPVRLDYGYKLNKDAGESSGEVHFSFGHAF